MFQIFFIPFYRHRVTIQLLAGSVSTIGVALMGRNRTGPPCNVGRPTAHVPGQRPTAHAAGPPAGSVTDNDGRRRQTPASKTILAH